MITFISIINFCFSQTIKQSTNIYAIINNDTAFYFSRNTVSFKLNKVDLRMIDSILKAATVKHKLSISIYKRQYIPFIEKDGKKKVWVNCFCDNDNNDWEKSIVLTEDGGDCFFNLVINLANKTYSDFEVNGVATNSFIPNSLSIVLK